MGKEKKEIWKLLELLNEYCMWAFVYDNDILRFRLWDRAKIEWNAILISKYFWFIKWLVENDKIDIDKVEFVGEWTTKYQSLLMLLSISDTPVEDLILYLK